MNNNGRGGKGWPEALSLAYQLLAHGLPALPVPEESAYIVDSEWENNFTSAPAQDSNGLLLQRI